MYSFLIVFQNLAQALLPKESPNDARLPTFGVRGPFCAHLGLLVFTPS